MNEPIRRLSMLAAMLFAALLVGSTWLQVIGAESINERPDNRRTALKTSRSPKLSGTVVSSGVVSMWRKASAIPAASARVLPLILMVIKEAEAMQMAQPWPVNLSAST